MTLILHADAPYTLSAGAQIITPPAATVSPPPPPPPSGGPIQYNGVGLIYNAITITYNQS
jgi:hypothetical protein